MKSGPHPSLGDSNRMRKNSKTYFVGAGIGSLAAAAFMGSTVAGQRSRSRRWALLRLSNASEESLGTSRTTDSLSPAFFKAEFWYLGHDVCIPAPAQRGRVQTLSAPVHARVLPDRHAGRRHRDSLPRRRAERVDRCPPSRVGSRSPSENLAFISCAASNSRFHPARQIASNAARGVDQVVRVSDMRLPKDDRNRSPG